MTKDFENTGFLFGGNSVFVEELFEQYLKNPNSVDASWQAYFQGYTDFTPTKRTARIIAADEQMVSNVPLLENNLPAGNKQTSEGRQTAPVSTSLSENSLRAKFMIRAYRDHGHMLANLDPLGLEQKKSRGELRLNLEDFGFSADNLDAPVDVAGEFGDMQLCTVGQLYSFLDKTYSGSIAAEFAHVESQEELEWLYKQLEGANIHELLSNDDRKKNLQDLVEVEGFEQYLHTKFPGAKRFSVEGGDSSIVCLDRAIKFEASHGCQDVVLGMAHRGRLSTITKVMKKPYRAVISEFMGGTAFPTDLDIAGDVKYHMGYSSDRTMADGTTVHLSLTPNPSHLEAVNPVVAGKVRSKQDLKGRDRKSVVGILIHGDAAFCGQGIVAESLVMSGLEPYDVGGIFHIVINNQIGFTANSYDSRPGRYCTEVAKMVGAPILHVNGDDVESVILATKIACEYRQKFAKDVVVDIICYRKYGHNEGDEPMYTQSMMYNVIKQKQTPAQIYASKLEEMGVIDGSYYKGLKDEFKGHLDQEYSMVEQYKPRAQWLEGNWQGLDRKNDAKVITGIDKKQLTKLGQQLNTVPDGFALNRKLSKLFSVRLNGLKAGDPIDWATGEQLAFATLLKEKIPVRITGQDAERGTFSHRHSVLHSQTDRSTYEPLNNVANDQAFFEVHDSNLSEYGVLGFEYGYSLVNPAQLVIWEGQFGDFANGAQIIFDQFIASAETKWLRLSGLVVLLPHGFEGQGPEHSSARLERFLQLAAEDNIQVVYPTTPASIFHLLRRQVLRNIRKPLIVMSPKSLLRHKLATSRMEELDKDKSFSPLLDEIDGAIKSANVKRIVFCSGKVYYDLLEKRRKEELKNVAIIRFEQLYPYSEAEVQKLLKKYNKAKEIVWAQEEPENMGAWQFIKPYLERSLSSAGIKATIEYVGRKAAASPAVGYLYVHNKEQEAVVNHALGMK